MNELLFELMILAVFALCTYALIGTAIAVGVRFIVRRHGSGVVRHVADGEVHATRLESAWFWLLIAATWPSVVRQSNERDV